MMPARNSVFVLLLLLCTCGEAKQYDSTRPGVLSITTAEEVTSGEPRTTIGTDTTATTTEATSLTTTAPVIQSTADPTAKPTTKSTAKPTTKSTAKPTTKSTAKPTTKSTAKPTTKSTAKPTTKSTAKPTTKSTAKPTTKSTAKPTTKSTAKPTTKSTAKPTAADPIREKERSIGVYDHVEREYEGYDGWYNNKAHPDWGGADLALTRRLPVAYSDGVYGMAGQDRPNPFKITWNTMRGLTGKPSFLNRTAFMTFFGQQVVEEILDAQRGGCPVEYENVPIPEWHEFRNKDAGTGYEHLKEMPFVRSRYSFDTGYSPNVPREQLNEITPWIDGGLVYGTTKAWADALRSFVGGRLADNALNNQPQFPEENKIRLPMANPPPPVQHKHEKASRFFKLGNPRGNENPFLLSFGILWFRWHNYWADKFAEENPKWSDEKIFLEARKWVIGTYQKFVFYDWLPAFLNMKEEEQKELKYTGYKSYVHPGVTHEFQSAAMRWGHTLVPPGVYRRNETCQYRKTTLKSTANQKTGAGHHGVRTCNSFWNPQLSVTESDIEEFLMGMASQITEREDNIITPDLQRRVFGPLEFSRRDLMVLNIQRGRDHGLPDYNTAREALGMKKRTTFLDINPHFNDSSISDIDETTLKRLEDAYDGDIDKVDIWAGGLFETTANGPGELFREIILDQFVRVRDGDRFWFENERNSLFTKEQIQYIHDLTVWDVIVRCTNVPEDAIQKDVFHFNEGDPCYDEAVDENQGGHGNQNRTVSEFDMDSCINLETYDYFEGSEVSFAVTFLAAGLWAVGCVVALFVLAWLRTKHTSKKRKLLQKQSRRGKPDKLKSYSASEWCGPKETKRPIQIMLGPGKHIKIKNECGNKDYRTIDLSSMQKLIFEVSADRYRRYVVIKFEHEYDLVVKFNDAEQRTEFISDLENWLGSTEVGIGRDRHEIREFELLKGAVTKVHRQKMLERFLRVAFAQAYTLDIDQDDIRQLEATIAKDILVYELTKTEFAEVLSMSPNSSFIQHMFDLVDKDQSETISFREFLDIIVIFAKGKPEDKLRLFFNMYDIDKSGHLSREEFKSMLRSMMDMVHVSEPTELDELIENLFVAAGFKNKEDLSFQDFSSLMKDYQGELSDAALQITGADMPDMPDLGPSSLSKGAATLIRRDNAPTRARKTIIKAYSDKDRGAVSRRTVSKNITIETVQKSYTDSKNHKRWKAVLRYVENYRPQIFWFTLYNLVLAGIFAERAYYYSIEREHRGLRRIAGFGVTVTRGAASAMMFTYSSLLLTMCRNIITKLRETFLHRYIPFDSALPMHKYIAFVAFLFTVLHGVGHGINFYHISTQPTDDLTCYFRDFFHASHEVPKFHYWCWQTITGFTGVLLVLVGAVIYTFAIQYARRKVFNLFWFTHNMYVVYYILMVLHGSGNLVQLPFFWYFFLGPAILFTLDKLVSIGRKKAEISVVKAELLPSDVTLLEFKRPVTFDYKSGQWVRIACKALGKSEYHPFTLSSAPHEENLTLHIRAIGPWTINLRQTYDPNILRDQPYPKVYLDGPYGEGHQDWYQFEVSVLVGGGIGVTPFASILKDIAHRSSQKQRQNCKKVYFIWVTRTQKHFEWLTDIICEVEEKDTSNLVTVHLFITQFFQKFDLRTTMLYICERHFQKISNRSLFTGLQSITHFGRPNFISFLDSLQKEHPEVGKIGVFSCGPPGMTSNVEKACVELNKFADGAAFLHHYENF